MNTHTRVYTSYGIYYTVRTKQTRKVWTLGGNHLLFFFPVSSLEVEEELTGNFWICQYVLWPIFGLIITYAPSCDIV